MRMHRSEINGERKSSFMWKMVVKTVCGYMQVHARLMWSNGNLQSV